MIGIGGAVGSLVMNLTLKAGGTYVPFLLVSAVGTLLGAFMFAMTGSFRKSVPISTGEPA